MRGCFRKYNHWFGLAKRTHGTQRVRSWIDYARAFSTFALLVGTPNSRRHTSARIATPSRICSCVGLAKQIRSRELLWALSVDQSLPGLIATPSFSAA